LITQPRQSTTVLDCMLRHPISIRKSSLNLQQMLLSCRSPIHAFWGFARFITSDLRYPLQPRVERFYGRPPVVQVK